MNRRIVALFALIAALGLAACSPVSTSTSFPPTTTAAVSLATLDPLATDVPGLAPQQWDAQPAMTIDPAKFYIATFKTIKGDVKVELYADKTPITVNNFVFLARQGFYDNTTFHRVLADFMAQGGDPTGTGSGGPGYEFDNEIHPDLTFAEPGLLAMANSGPDTNGSQFFITTVPTPQLDGGYTIFGKVVEGADVVLALTVRDPDTNPAFSGDLLKTVEIEERATSLLPPPTATPLPVTPVAAEGRPLAKIDVAARENLYNGRPAMRIDPAKKYTATIKTSQGDIVVELHPEDAPESVNNFVTLAELGYWDGFPIVFVQDGEFVLTGAPAGAPTSDVGYTVPSEIKRPQVAGAMGYWFRSDRQASSASQFYMLIVDLPDLDADFTAFGNFTAGLDVLGKLTTADVIETITIEVK